MSRQFSIDLHAVNISATPHPAGTYERIIQRIFAMRLPVPIWGERYALMTELSYRKKKGAGERIGASGVISTFTDIDVDAPWLNRRTGKAADDSDTDKIQIPETLRPHFAQFLFYFDFSTHTLSFQGDARMPKRGGGFKAYSFTPTHMQNYLSVLLENSQVLSGLDSINSTIIPDPNTLNEILQADNIREIRLVVTTPNTDNIATERGRVRARLARINAKKKVEIYVAKNDAGISPDEALIKAAKVSALDGEVQARVDTGSGVVPLSTTDKPLTERVYVDTAVQPEITTIKEAAQKLAKSAKIKKSGKPTASKKKRRKG